MLQTADIEILAENHYFMDVEQGLLYVIKLRAAVPECNMFWPPTITPHYPPGLDPVARCPNSYQPCQHLTDSISGMLFVLFISSF